MPRPSLIIFDLDGTLIDSRRDLAESANRLVAGYGGVPLPEARIVPMIGEGARTLVERVLRAAALEVPVDEALSRFLAIYDEHLLDWTRPYDGITETLARVPCAMAVLTNKPEGPSRRLLDAFGLSPAFARVIGGGSPFPRKPAPDGLLVLARDIGVPPGDTWMVGDSQVDLETAAAAGAHFVFARYGFGAASVDAVPPGVDVLERPADLLTLLARDGR